MFAIRAGQMTDAAEGFGKAVEEKLQALPITPSKEPENLFNRILQPGLQPASPAVSFFSLLCTENVEHASVHRVILSLFQEQTEGRAKSAGEGGAKSEGAGV